MNESEKIVQIPLEELQPNPLQPRGVITPESLTDLINSIRQHGILEPLVVADTPAGYQIIAGERRWRSAKILGLDTVPAIIRQTRPRQMLEMALIENVQREDLTALDRAKAFHQLQQEFDLSISEIAEKIGKSVSFVSNSIRLLDLPDAVKDGLLSGAISEGHARAIAGLRTEEKIVQAYKKILKEKASVRRAEEIARMSKKGQFDKNQTSEKKDKEQKESYKTITEDVKSVLEKKGKTKVKISRSRSQTKVTIAWPGGIEQTQDQLDFLYKKLCGETDS